MRIKISVVVLFLLVTIYSVAQKPIVNTSHYESIQKQLLSNSPNAGSLQIAQGRQEENLFKKYIEYRIANNIVLVYRIRIYSKAGNTAKRDANDEKNRFSTLYPDIVPYLTYDAPNFKVYVGDFKTQVEAFIALKKIKKDFPNAFYVPLSLKKLQIK